MRLFQRPQTLKRCLSVMVVALLLALCAGMVTASAPAATYNIVRLPPSAWQAPSLPDASAADLRQVPSHLRKISLDFDDTTLTRDQQGRVLAMVAADPQRMSEARRAVANVGGKVTKSSPAGDVLQCWLPVEQVEALARQAVIWAIRQPALFVLHEDPVAYLAAGTFETEALAAINVPAWHAAGYTGAGVRVGVIDPAGFRGCVALQGSELPTGLIMRNFTDGQPADNVDTTSFSAHGTACAEIIHDIAPGASLYLAKFSTIVDLNEAVSWLIENQVDVISTSFGHYTETPGDGTGPLADAVQRARQAGILWVTSAGNDREAHWGGGWMDSDGDQWHEFASGQEINWYGAADGSGDAYVVPVRMPIQVFLRWDDWQIVDQNYDLYIFRWDELEETWLEVASSTLWQTGQPGQLPVELCQYNTSTAGVYGYGIKRIAADRAAHFESFAVKVAGLSQREHARSLSNLADAPDVLTVAALNVASPWPQEDYSSEGPTNGLGGTGTGGAPKPELGGYAQVSTSIYGAGAFIGTSAAAPHAAGAAALIFCAFPGYTPDQAEAALATRARDMGEPGRDLQFGWGRLFLGDPPAQATPTATRTLGFTVTPSPTATVTMTSTPPTATPTMSPSAVQGRVCLPLIMR